MKWYQENFVNRRDWILDNLADLKMSYEEIVVVLLIDFFNSNNINITLELLAAKTNSSNMLFNIFDICFTKGITIRISFK